MKKIFTVLLTLFLITSCYNGSSTISIGYNEWIGFSPIILAKQMQFFKKEGVKVKLIYFSSLYDVMKAFGDEKIDIMLSTVNEVLLLADKGEKLKIILVIDYSNGADAIVAAQSITSVKNLKGKKIGVELGSISHFTLLKALQQSNMRPNEVTLVNMTGQEAINQFHQGKIDALVTWSPFTEEITKKEGHVIFSSKDIPGEIIDVMTVHQNMIDKSSKDCLGIVAAYLNMLDWFHQNKQQGINIISDINHTDPAQLENSLNQVQLTGLKENQIAFGDPNHKGKIYSTINSLIYFSQKNKLITRPLKANDLIDPNYFWQYEQPGSH